jgi:hypothetical protein
MGYEYHITSIPAQYHLTEDLYASSPVVYCTPVKLHSCSQPLIADNENSSTGEFPPVSIGAKTVFKVDQMFITLIILQANSFSVISAWLAKIGFL